MYPFFLRWSKSIIFVVWDLFSPFQFNPCFFRKIFCCFWFSHLFHDDIPLIAMEIFQTPRSSFTFVASRGTNRWLVVFGSTTHRPIDKMAPYDAWKICEVVDKMWFAIEDDFVWTENVAFFWWCFFFWSFDFYFGEWSSLTTMFCLTPPTSDPHTMTGRSVPFFRISNWDVWDSQQKQ